MSKKKRYNIKKFTKEEVKVFTLKKQSAAYLPLKDKTTDNSPEIRRSKAREFLKKHVSERFKDFNMVDFSRRYQ